MTDTFVAEKVKKNEFDEMLKNCAFGICFGFFLMFFSFVRGIGTYKGLKYVWLAAGILGFLIIVTTVIYPPAFGRIRRFMQKVFKAVFKFLLTVVTAVLYFLVVLPIGLLSKRNKVQKYKYYDSFDLPNGINSVFFDCDSDKCLKKYKRYVSKKKSDSGLVRFMDFVSENKVYIILPAALLLLFCGLLFWFVSSGVAQYFIYTIF